MDIMLDSFMRVFVYDGQGTVRGAILYMDRFCAPDKKR